MVTMNILPTNVNQQNESEIVLNIVIKAIRSIYPAWRTTIKTQAELDNIKKEWLTGFIDNNIKTDIQINRGLAEARKDTNPFLPSIGQFIEWCKAPHASHVEFKGLEYQPKKSSSERIKEIRNMSPEELAKLSRSNN